MQNTEISDLSLAVTANIRWFELLGLTIKKWQWFFIYENSQAFKDFVDKYFTGRVRVNPLEYSEMTRELKTYLKVKQEWRNQNNFIY